MAEQRKPDRTKYRPTPKRGERLPSAPRPGVFALLLPLLGAALGVALLLAGAAAVQQLADQHRRPELRMTVDSCSTVHRYRSGVTTCHGSRDPGSTDVLGARLLLHDAPKEYAGGTVVTVRCDRDGSCDLPTVGRHVLALGLTVLGLLVTGSGLLAVTVRAVDLFAPHRAELLRSRRAHRATAVAALAAVLLTVAGLLAHLFV
ncbi:hypothetical protein [Kitasatospora cheerisanensis]|uniref:Uncharacterized protein n=1 Tax=Kitasatospora cheerisanensis KCTC 2395 TaxID=1348663 RepID=A0A066Z6U4_9ACTN|nr:hypothetical protein [Kitasatospora cheerisanensis]KDN87969.1 hypothetical protein KCH_02960 [Kitasatospora cheerisanensis KCTC 2395]